MQDTIVAQPAADDDLLALAEEIATEEGMPLEDALTFASSTRGGLARYRAYWDDRAGLLRALNELQPA